MIKIYSSIAVAVIVLLTAQQGLTSQPVITGNLEGVELCAQFQCGVAVFTGQFKGQVNNQRAKGGFLVFINHEALPVAKATAKITSGDWSLRAGANLFQGNILGGTLFNNGDNTFTVTVSMNLTDEGTGEVTFTGVLDHNDFPPTIDGEIKQPAPASTN